MLTSTQIKIAKQIVEIFETGKVNDNYGTVTVLNDGAGISFGKFQATDHKDTLDAIVFRYLDKNGIYSANLKPYLDELNRDDTAKLDPKNLPQWAIELMNLLKLSGSDPIMKLAQDEIFDELYWEPAVKQGESMKLALPLSYSILYDTSIQSGPSGINNIRKRFPELPPSRNGDEKKWAEAYVNARRNWLLSFSNPVVQKTVYRMDSFLKIIKEDNWDFNKPLKVRGVNFF